MRQQMKLYERVDNFQMMSKVHLIKFLPVPSFPHLLISCLLALNLRHKSSMTVHQLSTVDAGTLSFFLFCHFCFWVGGAKFEIDELA